MGVRIYASLGILILLGCCACGGGSAQVEMGMAQKAMDDANDLHAEDFAPTEFQKARKSWDSAQDAVRQDDIAAARVRFMSAKINFAKAADIAKSRRDALSRELGGMQLMISSNLDKAKSDLSKSTLPSELRTRVKTIVAEVEKDNAAIRDLVKQDDLIKAVATAKEVQTKIYHAQLILAGKKPPKQLL